MSYYYEALNDQTFQKLVQAIIVAIHPETICLPVRQPDGGRDAFFFHVAMERKQFVVFQVKFSTSPKDKKERDAIQAVIEREKKKVDKLIQKGATHYYLVTNVQGTAHLDKGSIDKVNSALTESFGIPSYVWWRDDLDARLDNASDIKWSYPEICRATDVLQFLLKRPENSSELEAARAITAYMGKQHGDDRDVKFKQVELKRRITDLFVDLPVGHKMSRRERNRRQSTVREIRELDEYLDQLYDYEEYEREDESPFSHDGLAAAFLLNMPFGKGVSRFVLEGAPGQGKSTVTQFCCQVNRLKLLPSRRSEMSSVGNVHASAPTRAPFRIDLRDYAAWVSGRHPYAKAGEVAPPEEGQRSLESFLTMQVTWHSGGLSISQVDLVDFFVRSHSVVILDGFDEVADIPTRARVVEEICAAADRLDAHARSLQIIVTSRPAAFANSPGFPEDDWVHLELNDLKRSNIAAYKDKWGEAQDLTSAEQDALTATLEEKLRLPHLRDLSRNPMQLAILLQLMHVQGAALPDKRTALYEEYMKIFLNREVEKKQISGDHRELILSIHGLLAWVLQVQAETGVGSGSITMESLRREVANYLEQEEHEPDLVDSLLKGTVERVGALVSRVQGTFEFEVQPLREYFAARHLHKTAPYSPPGHAKKGTRPDRFSALASSFYWTNVTRFYCGFYDVGELPSLVDGLIGIGEEPGYSLITQPRRLAMMLLGDYVFSQSPRSMRRLINFIAREPDFQRLADATAPEAQRSMRLPETAGGKVLFEVCAKKLREEEDAGHHRIIRQVMARNGDRTTLKEFWWEEFRHGRIGKDPLSEARDFDLVERFDAEEIAELTKGNVLAQLHWLSEANLHSHILNDPHLYREVSRAFFNLEIGFAFRRPSHSSTINPFVVLSELLHPHILVEYFMDSPEHGFGLGRRDLFRQDFLRNMAEENGKIEGDPLLEFTQFVLELMELPVERWRTDLAQWEAVVDRGFEIAPGGRLFSMMAMIATAVSIEERDIKWEGAIDLFDPTPGLVSRLHFAKGQGGNRSWWHDEMQRATGEARVIFLCTLLCWAEPKVMKILKRQIGTVLDELDEYEWSWFWDLFSSAMVATDRRAKHVSEDWFQGDECPEERLTLTLSKRLVRRRGPAQCRAKVFLELQWQ